MGVGLRKAAEVGDLAGYDAFLLSSAVYLGHWLEPAQNLARHQATTLATRPTWLFSSGPIGGKPRPEEAVDDFEIIQAIRVREHRVFSGKLDRHALGFAETAVVLALRVPEGDFRDWDDIRGWARTIVAVLQADEDAIGRR